jgi:hypothetical protein
MMDAMIRLVKECERYELTKPPPGNDASSAAIHSRACESDVFDVFAQTLHVGGEKGRR